MFLNLTEVVFRRFQDKLSCDPIYLAHFNGKIYVMWEKNIQEDKTVTKPSLKEKTTSNQTILR